MSFDQFWETIATRNKWTPETRIEASADTWRKLCKQAYDQGAKQADSTNKTMDNLFRNAGMGRGFDL